jgi:hypothetical protein
VTWNHAYARSAMQRLGPLLGRSPGYELWRFAGRIGAPTSLVECGFADAQLQGAAQLVADHGPPNPRGVDYNGVLSILKAALVGDSPGVDSSGRAGQDGPHAG